MPKFLVETKGDIQVVGFGEEMFAHYNRPSVVGQTNFMQTHISAGAVSIITQLEDAATDVEFEKRWREAADKNDSPEDVAKKRESVLQGFIKEFELGAENPAKPAPKA